MLKKRYINKSKKLKNHLTAILLGSAIHIPFVHAEMDNLPDLGSPDLVEYDQATEIKLGNAFTQALLSEYNLVQDPEILNYVREIGSRIAGYSGQNRAFSFYVINNENINAFAGPNGVIGIHTSLITAVKDEAELASVVAHEIGHVTQNHLSRTYEYNSTQGSIQSFATLIAAVLVGMYNPNAGMATLMGGMGANMQNQLKNSRQHENEADNTGIRIMHQAGYNPHAMSNFFGRLSRDSQFYTHQPPEILRTHPVTQYRLASAANRADAMPPLKPTKSTNNLTLIRIRLAAMTQDFSQINVKKLTTAEQCYLDNVKELPAHLNNKRVIQSKKKLQCLNEVAQANLMQPMYSTLLIERIKQLKERQPKIELSQQIDNAQNLIEYQKDIWPHNLAVELRHAQLLNLQNKTLQAIQSLSYGSEHGHNQYQVNNYLGELAQQLNREALANFYQAKAQIFIGNYPKAKHFIEQAEKLNTKNSEGINKEIDYFQAKYVQELSKNTEH